MWSALKHATIQQHASHVKACQGRSRPTRAPHSIRNVFKCQEDGVASGAALEKERCEPKMRSKLQPKTERGRGDYNLRWSGSSTPREAPMCDGSVQFNPNHCSSTASTEHNPRCGSTCEARRSTKRLCALLCHEIERRMSVPSCRLSRAFRRLTQYFMVI